MNILLYTSTKDNFSEFTLSIKKTLVTINKDVNISEMEDIELYHESFSSNILSSLPSNVDFIIAVGDTGTFLRAIFLSNGKVPVAAASSEKISFFTEIMPQNIKETMSYLTAGNYSVDTYIRVALQENGKSSNIPALNEIAIFPQESAQLMRYTLIVDNNVIYRGRADGIIVATPLGSTGYALSANGPIAYGNPQIMLIVPVNPMNKEHMPIVAPISVKVDLVNLSSKSPIMAIIDGQLRRRVAEKVSITKASLDAKVVRFSKTINILSRLRNRLVELDLQNLEGVPPSAKYIFKLLHAEGGLTQSEIISATGLPSRTVRNALSILKKKGLIDSSPYLHDARKSTYFLV